MEQRGRKSAAALAVVSAGAVSKLPEPPHQLTPAQADIWRIVIASRSADMIDPEAYPVLVEYCRAVVTADQIAEQLAVFDPQWLADDGGLKRWDKLTSMQARSQGVISTLSVKLRLSPSARVRADAAGVIARKGAKRKPWETE